MSLGKDNLVEKRRQLWVSCSTLSIRISIGLHGRVSGVTVGKPTGSDARAASPAYWAWLCDALYCKAWPALRALRCVRLVTLEKGMPRSPVSLADGCKEAI